MAPASTAARAADSDKIWATVITNLGYLAGLLTFHHSLQQVGSKYPLLALYTESFPAEGRAALSARGIPSQLIRPVSTDGTGFVGHDQSYAETWTKLRAFELEGYERIVLVDSDMLVRRNMDELMDLELGDYVFAAGHACVCNPRKRAYYPKEWIPSNCAFTAQHEDPTSAQTTGYDPNALPYNSGLNSGLVVFRPSAALFAEIMASMALNAHKCVIAEQDLLSMTYQGRWKPLPYVYNALKTLRWQGVHDAIWRDESVKNVHYILSPKPWQELEEGGEWTGTEESHKWWVDANRERKAKEKADGITDGW